MERQLRFVAQIAPDNLNLFDSMRKILERRGCHVETKKLDDGAFLILCDKRIDSPASGRQNVRYGEIIWMP